MFTLTGAKKERPSWALTQDEYLKLQNQDDLHSLVFQSEWPLLHPHQIPERWLETDPGFPILLRHYSSDLNLPHWCIPAALDHYKLQAGQLAYRLKGPQKKVISDLTLIMADLQTQPWESIKQRYDCQGQVLWLSPEGHQAQSDWPKELQRTHQDFLFTQQEDLPSRILDLSFGKQDTFTYLHIHCLLNGASMELSAQEVTGKLLKYRSVSYGIWEIICVSKPLELE